MSATNRGGKRYPRLQNETKVRMRLVDAALRLEAGQARSLMQGLEVMDA